MRGADPPNSVTEKWFSRVTRNETLFTYTKCDCPTISISRIANPFIWLGYSAALFTFGDELS